MFYQGDLIRVRDGSPYVQWKSHYNDTKNKTGIVKRNQYASETMVSVQIDGMSNPSTSDGSFMYFECEIELIKRSEVATMDKENKVGREIIVLDGSTVDRYYCGWVEPMSRLVGNVYTIVKEKEYGRGYYINDGCGHTWIIDSRYVDFVSDTVQSMEFDNISNLI